MTDDPMEGYRDPGDGELVYPKKRTAIEKFKWLRQYDHPNHPYIRNYLQSDAIALVQEIETLQTAVKEAAELFRELEKIHIKKEPPDLENAKRYGELAYVLERVLRGEKV